MTYRQAATDDIPRLIQLRMEYLHADFGELSPAEDQALLAQLPRYFLDHLGIDLRVFVADLDSEIISTVFLFLAEKPANPHFITGRTGTLMNVYTCPPYRRQGHAAALVQMALDFGRSYGLSYVELNATNEGTPLYHKLGFYDRPRRHQPMKYIFNTL